MRVENLQVGVHVQPVEQKKLSSHIKSYLFYKRILDILISLTGLLFMWPLLLIACIAIRLETPGSPLYYQKRLGLNGRHIQIIKLRSMYYDAEKSGEMWAQKNDPRVTKVGLLMRKTRMDEVPQLINILKGEMSLIGPRPERPFFYSEFEKDLPHFVKRTSMKPGLSGWAQVNGGYDLTPEQKLTFDLHYIQHASLWFDIKILFKTIKVIITGDGAR